MNVFTGEPIQLASCSRRRSPPHSYNAKLTSVKQPVGAATVQTTAKYGLASPVLNATFTMPVPAGVSVQAYSSSPKLTTAPVFDTTTCLLTWTLGTATIRPGKSVKLSLNLLPTACSTPDALTLNGQFSVSDATGVKTMGVCLKKPVSK